jgi:hypothetical protein
MEHRKGAWGQMLGKAGSGRQRLPHPLHCEVWYSLLRNISTYMHVYLTFPIPDLEYMCLCACVYVYVLLEKEFNFKRFKPSAYFKKCDD